MRLVKNPGCNNIAAVYTQQSIRLLKKGEMVKIASMKRQMMRHNENMQQLMILFMTQERDSILQALQP